MRLLVHTLYWVHYRGQLWKIRSTWQYASVPFLSRCIPEEPGQRHAIRLCNFSSLCGIWHTGGRILSRGAGWPGRQAYENLRSLGGGTIVFDAPDRFHYLATHGQDIYVVQEQLKENKATGCLSYTDCTIHYYLLCLHENNTLYIFHRYLLWCIDAYAPIRHCTTAKHTLQQHCSRLALPETDEEGIQE